MLALEQLAEGRRRSASRSASSTSPARSRARSAPSRAKLTRDRRRAQAAASTSRSREGDRTIGVGTHRAPRSCKRGMSDCPTRPHPRGRPARRLPERARGHPDRRQGAADRRCSRAPACKRLEVTSFVRADVIPQLADAARGARARSTCPTTSRSRVLIPNERGLDNALRAARPLPRDQRLPVSASETHNRKNVNRSIEESLTGLETRARPRARARACAARA